MPLYTEMPVYPGDPEVSIEPVLTIEKDGWLVRRLQINSHDGTHVNIPSHSEIDGKNLDDLSLDNFCGRALIYKPGMLFGRTQGIIFRDQNIDNKIAEQIKAQKVPFVGLSENFSFDLDIEKDLLKASIISFENLTNLEILPDEFMFYGAPLKIKGGEGSPVRAFAVID